MSFYTNGDKKLEAKLDKYFAANDLQDIRKKPADLSKYMRIDYEKDSFRQEANESQPNDTPSRRDIFMKSVKLLTVIVTLVTFPRSLLSKTVGLTQVLSYMIVNAPVKVLLDTSLQENVYC